MTGWFGKSWGSPVCDPDAKLPTPVGAECVWCDEEIDPGDSGVLVPLLSIGPDADAAYHVECWLRQALGSVAHIEERCACFGGSETDPAGLSGREAAIAALAAYERKYGRRVL